MSDQTKRAWTRAEIAKLSDRDYEKHRGSIREWAEAGGPEGRSPDDPEGLLLPDDFRLTRRDVRQMSDAEFAANASKIREAVSRGELA